MVILKPSSGLKYDILIGDNLDHPLVGKYLELNVFIEAKYRGVVLFSRKARVARDEAYLWSWQFGKHGTMKIFRMASMQPR